MRVPTMKMFITWNQSVNKL